MTHQPSLLFPETQAHKYSSQRQPSQQPTLLFPTAQRNRSTVPPGFQQMGPRQHILPPLIMPSPINIPQVSPAQMGSPLHFQPRFVHQQRLKPLPAAARPGTQHAKPLPLPASMNPQYHAFPGTQHAKQLPLPARMNPQHHALPAAQYPARPLPFPIQHQLPLPQPQQYHPKQFTLASQMSAPRSASMAQQHALGTAVGGTFIMVPSSNGVQTKVLLNNDSYYNTFEYQTPSLSAAINSLPYEIQNKLYN